MLYAGGTDRFVFNRAIEASTFHGNVTGNVSGSAGTVTSLSNRSIGDLSDVDITTSAPGTGNMLTWDGSKFTPATPYSTSNFNTDFGTKTTSDLSEGSNLYFTDSRARSSLSLGTAGSRGYNSTTGAITIPGTTDHITEGTNLFYTNSRVDTRISNTAISGLSNVITTGITNGQILIYNNTLSRFEPGNQSSGSTITVQDEGTPLTTDATTLNFVGAGVTASGTGTVKTITISGGGGGGGSSTFAGLTDTPASFTGGANKFVKVNSAGNALEYIADPGYLTTIAIDSINDTHIDFGTGTNQVSTSDIPEDTNLYYTQARFDTAFTAKSTSDLSEGTNLYFTDARVDTHLNQSNPTAGYVLSWNGSDYSWVAQSGGGGGGGLTDIVNDPTPQLGGNLDTNNNAILFGDSNGTSTNILKMGVSQDLFMYHDGNHSYIKDVGTGNLKLGGTQVDIVDQTSSSVYAMFAPSTVRFNINNSTKMEIDSSKVSVVNDLTIGGNLTVNGTTTTVNSNTVNIGDNILVSVSYTHLTLPTTPYV